MRVLHLITVNGIGGAEKLMLDLLSALKREKVESTCIVFHRKSTQDSANLIYSELFKNGIEVRLKEYSFVLSMSTIKYIRLCSEGFDVVHSHLTHCTFWAFIVKLKHPNKLVWCTTFHGYSDAYHNKNGLTYREGIRWNLRYWVYRAILSRLDGAIFISKGLESLFKQAGLYYKKSLNFQIYHGTTKLSDAFIITRKNQCFQFVIPGRLVKFKGHIYALKAMRLLLEKGIKLELHLYGTGPEEQYLKRSVQVLGLNELVVFHGHSSSIIKDLSLHDAAIIPSIGESFGLVFFDVFKARLPTIAFDVPASNEIIVHNINGLLARPKCHVSLADEMERIIKDQELRERLIAGALLTLENFSTERMAGSYKLFYEHIIERNRKS